MSKSRKRGVAKKKGDFVAFEQTYEGPLPQPDALAKYNVAHPDAAKIILEMAQKQQDFATAYNNKNQKHEIIQTYLGQFLGFVLCVLLIAAAVYGISCESTVAAGILAAIGVGTIIAVFLRGKPKKSS